MVTGNYHGACEGWRWASHRDKNQWVVSTSIRGLPLTVWILFEWVKAQHVDLIKIFDRQGLGCAERWLDDGTSHIVSPTKGRGGDHTKEAAKAGCPRISISRQMTYANLGP